MPNNFGDHLITFCTSTTMRLTFLGFSETENYWEDWLEVYTIMSTLGSIVRNSDYPRKLINFWSASADLNQLDLQW